MGKIIFHLKIFCVNIINLVVSLLKHQIFWSQSLLEIMSSKIQKKTRLIAPYTIYNSSIAEGTYIASNSKVSFTEIGKYCSIGPNFFCGYGVHPANGISTHPAFYSLNEQAGFTFADKNLIEERKLISIGNDVFIGMNVTVLDGVSISDGAIIGAGAIVSKDIPPYAIAVGNPIKIIKYRFSKDIIENLMEIKWWDLDHSNLKLVNEYFYDIEKFIQKVKEIKTNI